MDSPGGAAGKTGKAGEPSCRFCDEIAVFHQGRIAQQGSHEQLVADKRGKYHELWQAQAQYYK